MSVAVVGEPQVVHTLPGRVRVHLPGWSGQGKCGIEAQLRKVAGVWSVRANPLTGNVLIQFDPSITQEQTILAALPSLEPGTPGTFDDEPSPPPVIRERRGRIIRARIPVRGLDRDPQLAKRVVDHLKRRPGVHVQVSQLTGRVLVEFTEHEADLDDLIAGVTGLELPELPGEDRPAYPLDPGPLRQSVARTTGSALGLGLLAVRRLAGFQEPLPGANAAIQISSIIGILQGIPPFRYGLRKLLGRTVADLLVSIPGIITLTIASNPFGLALIGAESLRLLTEVLARRAAWRRHEERVANASSWQPDAVIHLEAGERTPLPARVVEGTGTMIGRDGLPSPAVQGGMVPAGARLYGGPFVLRLESDEAFEQFTPEPRPAPVAPAIFDRYLQVVGPLSLLYAGATALLTRSYSRTLAALLLVNSRTAAIGLDGADLSTSARVLRAGVTEVGTRTNRNMRLPDLVLLDGARLLCDGLELTSALPLTKDKNTAEILAWAAGVAAAAGSPWGGAFRAAGSVPAAGGTFDGKVASAKIEGVQFSLGPIEDWASIPEAARLKQRGSYVLVLRSTHEELPLGIFALRPKLAPGAVELVHTCQRYGVELWLLTGGDQIAMQAFAHRAKIALLESDDAVRAIRAKQQEGAVVAFVSDNAGAAMGFNACDLAIGITDDRSYLPARADLLAPDLTAVAAIIEAGAYRKATIRDSVVFSALSNVAGAVWGIRGMPGIQRAGRVVFFTAFGALVDGWLRLRGGKRPGSTIAHLVDPHPERWGLRSVESVLHILQTSEDGLSEAEAASRRRQEIPPARQHPLVAAFLEQVRSPLLGMLAAGAGLSLLASAVGDVVIITATILATVAAGAWQEYKASKVTEALKQMGTSTAHLLRGGEEVTVAANEVVPGDVLLLAPGDRVAADARLLSSRNLEADESALTGESLPVPKAAEGGTDASRIVLEGSDITVGTGRAVVVAVGHQTRLGATSAALSADGVEQSPLSTRLARMLHVLLPLSVAGGGAVIASGLLRGQLLMSYLATGVSTMLACVPEGLPLLSRVGEAGVAHRLTRSNALVRRLSVVEALGRVNVACTDKTGTLTEGHLRLSVVSDGDQEARLPGGMPADLQRVLLTAALASPHPDASDVAAHPTDMAVIQGAMDSGLGERLQVKHDAELSFDPVRSFHATVAQGRLCVKGAPETLISRCTWILRQGENGFLDENGQQELLARSQLLAKRGLRVLMVAEGSPDTPLDNPQGLTALGFIGISDPLRYTVPGAVRRCRDAGVRVIMITGDHPATARTIAGEAGLLEDHGEVLTATEIADLQNSELDARLKDVAVIARATPLDKLRIIESLRRQGHTVAMTGDGVNDAPALRLADVGVAMGRSGTEVARQTADLVLIDDDFSTLVETFVEGRSFWRNIRRSLGLLLGGNLGELGLIVGASLFGFSAPLSARQILAMNAITDILPALAVVLQQPEHRNLAWLSREGESRLDKTLRRDILRRSIASFAPSFVSYVIMLGSGMLPEARTVAYASIIATQLAQTLDAGRSEGGLTRSVFAAVAGSAGVLLATLTVPPLRNFLTLVMPSPLGWALIGAGALAAVAMSRILAIAGPARSAFIQPSA